MTSHLEEDRPIRIAVDARHFSSHHCGFTVYLTSVLEPLRKAGLHLTLLSNQPIRAEYRELEGLETSVFGSGGLRWEQLELPKYLKDKNFDLYFGGSNRGIPWRKNPKIRYVLTLLDIIPFKLPRLYFFEGWARELRNNKHYRNEIIAILLSIARADTILTISKTSQRDIAAYFRLRNVATRQLALKTIPTPERVAPKNQFVYIGGIDRRKKVDVLLRAFARFRVEQADFNLVLIGSGYSTYQALIDDLGLTGHVIMLGNINHDTKFKVLSESQAMVYPSLYEGFGLAIAEGFQAGIPVIAGRGGSQEEVGGDAVRYIDPVDPDEIASAMKEMLDQPKRDAWIMKGREQLKVLTDERIKEAIVDYFLEQGKLSRNRRDAKPSRI